MSVNPVAAVRFLDAGDCHLVVEFGSTIDLSINRRVVATATALRRRGAPGITEILPTYRSMLVRYDPVRLGRDDVISLVRLELGTNAGDEVASPRQWRIPVVYGGAFGPDLEAVAARHGLTCEDVIELHAGAAYTVFMIGFAPGYAYLGGLHERLHTPRRGTPRMKTPPGSVSIGGMQAGIASIELPSGWNLLGRTPVRTFDLTREPACLLRAGDRIRFMPVPAERFDEAWSVVPEDGAA